MILDLPLNFLIKETFGVEKSKIILFSLDDYFDFVINNLLELFKINHLYFMDFFQFQLFIFEMSQSSFQSSSILKMINL
jgi:hypothetical protein